MERRRSRTWDAVTCGSEDEVGVVLWMLRKLTEGDKGGIFGEE